MAGGEAEQGHTQRNECAGDNSWAVHIEGLRKMTGQGEIVESTDRPLLWMQRIVPTTLACDWQRSRREQTECRYRRCRLSLDRWCAAAAGPAPSSPRRQPLQSVECGVLQ